MIADIFTVGLGCVLMASVLIWLFHTFRYRDKWDPRMARFFR